MAIRAEMRCDSVQRSNAGNENGKQLVNELVSLNPVSSESNRPWGSEIPEGNLTLSITNMDAQGQFEIGKRYIVDIEPAGSIFETAAAARATK